MKEKSSSLVVDSGQDGDGLFGNIDTGKDGGGLGNTGQSLVENFGWEMRELEEDVVLFRSDTSSFSNLQSHGSGYDISRSQILGGRGVSLHESLSLRVE
jgi:hypothetical protein